MADNLTEPYFAISESRLKEILRLLRLHHNYINYADVSEQVIRANPVPSRLSNSPTENNNPVPNSKELILLAQTDWHNREERKHRYEMIPWTMGWMTGFLSERKPYWPKVHEAAIRKDEREKVLRELIAWAKPIADNYCNNDCHRDPFSEMVSKCESLRSEITAVSKKESTNGS